MGLNKWDLLTAFRIIMLLGGAIYLTAFGLAMFNPFTWHPDFIAQHGEPFLVLSFALWLTYEAYCVTLKLPNSHPNTQPKP